VIRGRKPGLEIDKNAISRSAAGAERELHATVPVIEVRAAIEGHHEIILKLSQAVSGAVNGVVTAAEIETANPIDQTLTRPRLKDIARAG
jgi:hypothetical protein